MLFTILKRSEVVEDNTTCRIDAEYFKIEYLAAIEKIKTCRFSYIDELTSWVTQGPNPKFTDNGIPCLTGRNINKGSVSYENSDYVDTEEYKRLSRYQLIPGDTLITLKGKGSIGKIGYVTENKPAIFSRDIGIIRPKGINPCYLNLFILCKYGKLLVDRGETGGTGQSTLTTSYLKSIPVPRFGIEENIGRFLDKTEQLNDASSQAYNEAQTLLLSELGLNDWQPKHRLSFVKNYSETEQAKRLDAEHFQPSCDEILQAVQRTGQSCKLEDTVSLCQRGKQPKYCEKGKVVINSKHVRSGEVVVDNNRQGMVSNASVIMQQSDMLINGTGIGTIGRCAPYLHDHTALPDNHVTVLRAKGIDPVFLATQLNSVIGQEQVKKFQRGSSGQIELYPDDINRFTVWKAPKETQQKIRDKIKEGHNAKLKSQELLASAKRAVELAIEQDEQTAMDWLKKETKIVQQA